MVLLSWNPSLRTILYHFTLSINCLLYFNLSISVFFFNQTNMAHILSGAYYNAIDIQVRCHMIPHVSLMKKQVTYFLLSSHLISSHPSHLIPSHPIPSLSIPFHPSRSLSVYLFYLEGLQDHIIYSRYNFWFLRDGHELTGDRSSIQRCRGIEEGERGRGREGKGISRGEGESA